MRTETYGPCTCIQGDCMDYMKTLPDKAFDLAIVDPPYGDAGGEWVCGRRIAAQVPAGQRKSEAVSEEVALPSIMSSGRAANGQAKTAVSSITGMSRRGRPILRNLRGCPAK
jgi:hypothetical protein